MVVVAPLVGLGVVALVLWVIAMALAIALIMDKIGAIFHGVPIVGGYIEGAAKSVARGLTEVAGKLEDGADHLIGAAWHLFARYLDQTWNQFVSQAHVLAMLAHVVGDQIYSVSGLRALVHDLTRRWHGIEHGVKTLEREFHGIEHMVKQLTRDLTKGIGHDLRLQVKVLEHDVTRIDHRVIPALEAADAQAAKAISDLWSWSRQHVLVAGTTAFAGAVAIALTSLGLGGLRCPSFLNSLNKRGCGLWGGLEDILGLLVDTALLANICNLIGPFEQVVSDVAVPVVVGLTDVGAGLCAGSVGAPSVLAVPALSLPASPGFTLNLP